MTNYRYPEWVEQEIRRCCRMGLFPPRTALRPATFHEDVTGTDDHVWIVGVNRVPLQIRVRYDRPAMAPDIDITFRHTEPAMIAAGTYAPLALFIWTITNTRQIVAAKLIDVYRMASKIQPSLTERALTLNLDESSAFLAVGIGELYAPAALLRTFDGMNWNTPTLGGEARLNRILESYRAPVPSF
jgi:hypothetical protein